MEEFENILQILYKSGSLLSSCSEKQVNRIERTFNIKLPLVYRSFLLNMGKSAGDFMKGSSCFYNEIFSLKEAAVELLEERNFKSLPEDSYVFWMHQGYQFAFFLLSDGDNPRVFFFTEVENNYGHSDFTLQNNKLTDFYYDELKMSGIIK